MGGAAVLPGGGGGHCPVLSWQFNPPDTLSLVPVVFLQAALIYGGNEEVGWRGTMQPLLERAVPFPGAAVVTGLVWAVWHLPCGLWRGPPSRLSLRMVLRCWQCSRVSGTGRSFRRTRWVFGCNLAHGLTNTLLSLFVIQVNGLLAAGVPAVAGGLWSCGTEPLGRRPWGEGEKGKGRGECREKGLPFPAPYGTIS